MKTIPTPRLFFLSLMFLALAGCRTAAPSDWRYLHPAGSVQTYVRGDYLIAERGRGQFVLIFRPPGHYVRVGVYRSLSEAQAATGQFKRLN